MARRQYLISYDIADDKRRTQVFKTLTGQGDHVQFSVFLCALNRREWADLRGRLGEMIHHRDDQIIILDLGDADSDIQRILDCLGKRYNPAPRVRII